MLASDKMRVQFFIENQLFSTVEELSPTTRKAMRLKWQQWEEKVWEQSFTTLMNQLDPSCSLKVKLLKQSNPTSLE
ncbi:MAG: hypothetical protein ACI35O_04350 [Bacillaceae bacterium]